jgi:outer membrane protein TolC
VPRAARGAREAEVRRIGSNAEAANARAALNVVIGAPLEDLRPLAPLGELPQAPTDESAIERTAFAARPELLQARLRERLAAADVTAARSAFLPQVSAQGAVEANGHSFADRASSWAATRCRNVFAGGGDAARRSRTRVPGRLPNASAPSRRAP